MNSQMTQYKQLNTGLLYRLLYYMSLSESQEEQQWKWVQCTLVLENSIQKGNQTHSTFQLLSPAILIEDKKGQMRELQFKIKMEKPFLTEEHGQGWTWHKNCMVPAIDVILTQQQLNYLEGVQEIGTLYCQVKAVYPIKKQQFHLHQVALIGESKKKILKKETTFYNLRFSQTSFHHSKNKFSLLVWIYLENPTKSKYSLKALMSSQVYIDSRKQARKKVTSKCFLDDRIELNRFTAPITMKIGKKLKRVQNSAIGFLTFYSAQNIRSKIKHPFFLAYHFSNTFDLYFNHSEYGTAYQCLKNLSHANKNNSKSIIIFIKCENELKKRMISLFQNWRLRSVILLFEDDYFDPKTNWVKIPYQEIYPIYKQYLLSRPAFQLAIDSNDKNQEIVYQLHHAFILQKGQTQFQPLKLQQSVQKIVSGQPQLQPQLSPQSHKQKIVQ